MESPPASVTPLFGYGSKRKSQARALLVAILIMLGIAGGTGWLVAHGLAQGTTWFPAKLASQQRRLDRAREPVMFWVSLGLYGVICCGALGAAGWLAREGLSAPDGVFRRAGPVTQETTHAMGDPPRESFKKTLTLDEVREWVAQTKSVKQQAAAAQLLTEALALPNLPAGQRDAAIARIRQLDPKAADYYLESFGARVLEMIGDALTDPAVKKVAYAEAVYLAWCYASGASSGGEGTARSRRAQEIEAKLHALDPRSHSASHDAIKPSDTALATSQLPPSGAAPPLLPQSQPAQRPPFLSALSWTFIGLGALATPVSVLSLLMILAGGDGSSGGSLSGALIVLGGPPATLIAGIGLLRRQRWAYGYALAMLAVFSGYSLVQILRGSTPERSTVSPSGLITTELAWSVNYPLHFLIIAICVGLIVKLRAPAIRAEFARSRLGPKTG